MRGALHTHPEITALPHCNGCERELPAGSPHDLDHCEECGCAHCGERTADFKTSAGDRICQPCLDKPKDFADQMAKRAVWVNHLLGLDDEDDCQSDLRIPCDCAKCAKAVSS